MAHATETASAPQVSDALGLPLSGVEAVLRLASDGATVPFIARYRKESTGGLDEEQIRRVVEEAAEAARVEKRRSAILSALDKQAALTPELRARLEAAGGLGELEAIYLPLRAKRRTRAQRARDSGLEPLAEAMWQTTGQPAAALARKYVDPSQGVPDVAAALQGARDLCAERLAEDPDLRVSLREAYFRRARVVVTKAKATREQVTNFDHQVGELARLGSVPSHRWLACCRGEAAEVLRLRFEFDSAPLEQAQLLRLPRAQHVSWKEQAQLWVRDAFARLLLPAAKADARRRLGERAQREAIDVFAANLRQLLLAPPLGARPVLGIDPGQRTGCKCALVDAAGKLVAVETIFLVQGPSQQQQARTILSRLARETPGLVVAVGNGTHGRETHRFASEVIAEVAPGGDSFCVSVSEAGASVYSASEVARREFPDLDLTFRGAVSIARRLQDPLAELVKIEPRSIGVGQYQHDLPEARLDERLAQVVESCVSSVGVDLNTASEELLRHVAGLGPKLAAGIVAHRHHQGRFHNRQQLLSVAGLGARAFEQSAGFLRVHEGDQPLDTTSVHPERYAVVEAMAHSLGSPVAALLGDPARLQALTLDDFRGEGLGEYTLRDIVAELSRPGRDPRQEFAPPAFAEGISRLEDLRQGMKLAGVVTNVAAFGAFVDIGVHHDGLIHVSKLDRSFVRDPTKVVRVGQHLEVEVLEIDTARRRINLARVLE